MFKYHIRRNNIEIGVRKGQTLTQCSNPMCQVRMSSQVRQALSNITAHQYTSSICYLRRIVFPPSTMQPISGT